MTLRFILILNFYCLINCLNVSESDQVTEENRIAVPVTYAVEDQHVWRRSPQPFVTNLENTGAATFQPPTHIQEHPSKVLKHPASFSYQQIHGSKDLNPAPTLQYWGTKGYYDDLTRNQTTTEPTVFENDEVEKENEESESQEQELEEIKYPSSEELNQNLEDEPEGNSKEEENEELEDEDEEEKEDLEEDDDNDAHTDYSETKTKLKPAELIDEANPQVYSDLLQQAKQEHDKLFKANRKQYGRRIDDEEFEYTKIKPEDSKIQPITYKPEDNEEDSEISTIRNPTREVPSRTLFNQRIDSTIEANLKPKRKPRYRIVRVYDDEDDDATPSNSDIIELSTPKVHPKLQPILLQKVEDNQSSPPVYTIGEVGEETQSISQVKDNKPQESTHEAKKAKKKGPTKFKKGGGKEHDVEYHSDHGEKGDKGYKGYHKYEKGEKGHHDKEAHKGSYSDHGGHEKKHHHEDGHHGGHEKGEKGQKGAKYDEHGKHEKGHSTKGEHNIHKNDEYEKKHEFFDEYHEGGESEKHGGFHEEHEGHKGGSEKGGHHKSEHDHGEHGKKGKSEKGDHYDEDKGHKNAAGHDEHYHHTSKYGKKEGHDHGKKYGFKKGKARK